MDGTESEDKSFLQWTAAISVTSAKPVVISQCMLMLHKWFTMDSCLSESINLMLVSLDRTQRLYAFTVIKANLLTCLTAT